MIKFVSSGGRGEPVIIEATVFDLLSLQEGLTSAVIHLDHVVEDYQKRGPDYSKDSTEFQRSITLQVHEEFIEAFKVKAQDARANYNEVQAIIDERNRLIDEEDAKARAAKSV